MEKPGGCTGGSEIDDDRVLFKSMERNQRKLQLKMKAIFKKYDHPFENDVVVYMEDLTYATPRGRRSWIDETPISENMVEQFSGQVSTALVKRKNPDTEDWKGFASTPNDVTIDVASPLKTTVPNLKSFIDMNNTQVLLKSPGRSYVAFFEADDREATHNEETSFFEPGNTTLEDIYPQMVLNMSNIWNINIKAKLAFNILQHYRRQIKCKQKFMSTKMSKTYTVHQAPHVEEPVKALGHTLLQDGCSSRSALGNPVESQNPSLFLHKLGSPVESCTHRHLSNSIKTFEPAFYRDIPHPGKLHKEEDFVTALGYPSIALSDFCKMYSSMTRITTNKGQMDVAKSSHGKDSRQQHSNTLSRRKSFSEFSLWHSPKDKVAKANCNMSEIARSPSNYLTSQGLVAIERVPGSYKEHPEKVDSTRSLTRRNSFSAFPVAHSSDFTLGKAKVQFSSTISSLVNSPGSVRAKRPPSHDLSFSISKKYRSATDAVIGTFKPSSQWSPKLSESNSTLRHSVVASALPAHMWLQSPGSQRFVSPPKNARSPKRTSASLYRKLTYQEDDN